MKFNKKYFKHEAIIYALFLTSLFVFGLSLELGKFTPLFLTLVFYYLNAATILVNLGIFAFYFKKNKDISNSAIASIFAIILISALVFVAFEIFS